MKSPLVRYLEASDEAEEECELARLMAEHADPTIARVLAYKLKFYVNHDDVRHANPDVEDIYHDIRIGLLKRLRDLKKDQSRNGPSDAPIGNFKGYVATIASNTCDEYLRGKYPRRRELKDRIRYYLTNQGRFSLWRDPEQGWLCGLTAETATPQPEKPNGQPRHDNSDGAERLVALFQGLDAASLTLPDLIDRVLQASGSLELDQLTASIAGLLRVEDRSTESIDQDDYPLSERLAGAEVPQDVALEYQEILRQLWAEICLLPRRQRIALLFNLKNPNGVNVITLLPATGLATFEEIAETLEIPVDEFERIWANLPMDDLNIATYLGARRQQVINLRKTARERLARRMQSFEKGTHGGHTLDKR